MPLLVCGVGLSVLAVRHARRHPEPLVNLALLAVPTFRANVTGGSIFRLTAGAMPFVLPLMLQVGFGFSAFNSGLVTLAGGLGSFFNKMSTGPILRRFGYRTTFTVNAIIAGVSLALCALFTATTPMVLMFLLLFVGGFFRSLQFTALNSLAFAEITPQQMSAATSFSSMMQQMTNGMGVALAAIVLNTSHIWGGSGDSAPLTPVDFRVTLITVGALALLSIPFFRQLSPTAGADITGHRPRAAPALEESAAE